MPQQRRFLATASRPSLIWPKDPFSARLILFCPSARHLRLVLPRLQPPSPFRLLIFTGCRLGEIQTLKWSYVRCREVEAPDGESEPSKVYWLALPDSKTGAKKVYLGQEAADLLEAAERLEDNEYVITGEVEGQYLTDLQKPWRRIRKRAGLEDVRIHDLRHSFASVAVCNGESLPMLSRLLGHTVPQTTSRYAHLADDPMQGAAGRVSAMIAQMLNRSRQQSKRN